MIRSPSKIAKCTSKALPENLQHFQKAMQASKKYLDMNAKLVSVGDACILVFFSLFQDRRFSYCLKGSDWTTVNLTSFCDKIQFSRQFERVANMSCIRT